jgi:glycosyltransferase involved in cell wall biosynthesis
LTGLQELAQQDQFIRAGSIPASPPKVSAIVAAYCEQRYIGACLSSLLAQTYRPFEIIVIDDGSRDETASIAASFEVVRLIRQSHRGAALARNRGAQEAAGDILVFVDADMVFPSVFIERLTAPMRTKNVVGTFTKEIYVANSHRMWARAHMLGRGLPADRHFGKDFPDEWDIFRAVRKDAFFQAGGFEEVGYGEDRTLGAKLSTKAIAAPGATCFHHEPDSLAEVYRSARWFGRGSQIQLTRRPAVVYGPPRSLARALKLAARHRMPSLFVYRLVWDLGVLIGWMTRSHGSVK